MTERNSNIDAAIEITDASKRATLRKLVIGSAFVAPAVATFALDGFDQRGLCPDEYDHICHTRLIRYLTTQEAG